MLTFIDEVRHIKETAVYTNWCSFQQTTKRLCSIIASISRIIWVRHHLLHRESHQGVTMKDIQGAPRRSEELGHIGELIGETLKSSETVVCRIYSVCRTDSIDAAPLLLFSKTGKPETISPTSDALRFHLTRIHCQVMTWRNAHCPTSELTAQSEMGRMLGESGQHPVLMALSPILDRCLDMVACSCRKQCKIRRCKSQKSGLRCTQCVHVSIRLMIRRLAWKGIREDWLWWLKAVPAGVPIQRKSPKSWFGKPFCLC